MDETINGGEGRVTRSLRKRLTSIDSETTSRPGTPVQSVKLNTISETRTASPPRTTRGARQATTPLKTPAKRLSTLITDIVGSAETTPVKRLTRRRFSAVDDENNRQTLAKVTDCDPLAEKVRSPSVEIQPAEQSGSKTTKRKIRRPGPRSKTRDNLDTLDSDVEIIGEEQTFNTNKIETCIDLSGDNEENIGELSIKDPRDSKLVKQETHTIIDISEDQEEYDTIEHSPNAKSLTKDMKLEASSPEAENQAKNSKPDERKQEHLESHLSDCKESSKNVSMNGQAEYNVKIDSKEIAVNDEKSEEVQRSSISNKTAEADNTNEVNGSSAEILQNPMGNVKNPEGVNAVENEKDVQDGPNDNLSQPPLTTSALKETPGSETANTPLEARPVEARVIEVVEICKPSDISKYITDPSEKLEDKIVEEKSVLFANVAHDETPKQVFPKTPIITKTRSYIEANCSSEDNSFHSTKDSGEKSFDQHMIKEEDIPGKEENAIEADKSIDDDVNNGEEENGKDSNAISKLSNSAKCLSDSVGLDSDMNMDEKAETNQSRKQTLNDKGAMERFHKSLRKLQVSDSTDENDEENPKFETKKKRSSFPATLAPLKKRLALSSTNKLSKSLIEYSGSSASDSTADPIEQDTTKKKARKESLLGDVSITADENKSSSSRDEPEDLDESVANKEVQKMQKSNENLCNVSLEKNEKTKICITNRLHSSISMNVAINDKGNSKSADRVNEDLQEYDKLKQMPLGNPLVRTRRQSLYLPSNPNMEISSSTAGGGKKKRKTLSVFNIDEFNPSQSFIESLELRKQQEDAKLSSKPKRLSKSFSGAGDSFENSAVDMDVRHFYKDSNLILDESQSKEVCLEIAEEEKSPNGTQKPRTDDESNDSEESLEPATMQTKLKDQDEKCSQNENGGNSTGSAKYLSDTSLSKNEKYERKEDVKHAVLKALRASANILLAKKKPKPLEESEMLTAKRLPTSILEALAQTEDQSDKKKCKKNILRKKKTPQPQQNLRLPSTFFEAAKNKVNAERSPLKIRTSAGVFIERPLTPVKKKRKLPETIVQTETQVTKKKSFFEAVKKGENPKHSLSKVYTSAGIFIEEPIEQSKEKKPKTIMTSAGPVTVEPITPTKPTHYIKGIRFRESPINPWSMGFKVRRILADEQGVPFVSEQAKKRKIRRKIEEPTKVLPKPQWTSSGFFIEEELPLARPVTSIGATKFMIASLKRPEKLKKPISLNFKESALMRNDIKRTPAREIMQRKERIEMQKKY
uniref:Uncharacterized protein n=1 Tax=Glossina pallidipes TaxID=7398 RepID=A0A1A9Z496_GLOPL